MNSVLLARKFALIATESIKAGVELMAEKR